jgi:hypothetical protein
MMAFLRSMLTDIDGDISSKRVITFLAFLLCSVAFVSNIFWKYEVDTKLFEDMMYIVVAGLGFTASEKFTSKRE